MLLRDAVFWSAVFLIMCKAASFLCNIVLFGERAKQTPGLCISVDSVKHRHERKCRVKQGTHCFAEYILQPPPYVLSLVSGTGARSAGALANDSLYCSLLTVPYLKNHRCSYNFSVSFVHLHFIFIQMWQSGDNFKANDARFHLPNRFQDAHFKLNVAKQNSVIKLQ